jgi:hypothetical protein
MGPMQNSKYPKMSMSSIDSSFIALTYLYRL